MEYGIIGNCAYSALAEAGRMVWLCWPRMDSSPVFGALLDDEKGGSFDVEAIGLTSVEQTYVENTNILRTVFHSDSGSFELLDFAPRFRQYGRSFKPNMLVRILRPLEGEPLVRVGINPTYDYGRADVTKWMASNHIEFNGLPAPLRLTSNIPLTYLDEGRNFVLTNERHLVLTYGEPLQESLEETANIFLDQTCDYWRRWVKSSRIPRDYQKQVIRSALVLKLHQYEDTGAIIASTTTSLPEFPGSGRCWDYRFCWLRDAYFSLNAFERLGHFDEMERFLAYLRTILETHGGKLQPLYSVSGKADLSEEILDHLDGFRGEKPVRIGNQAHEHVQNDIYGEMILAISRLLLDSRFVGFEGLGGACPLIERLLDEVEKRLEDPDAGLWELRGEEQLHTFTLLTHWAGARRAAEVGDAVGARDLSDKALRIAEKARSIIETRCTDPDTGALTQSADKKNLDAATLLALHFGFWEPDDPAAARHVEAIGVQLNVGGLLRRYDVADDFGQQEAAFTVCSFWMVEALAIVGKKNDARILFERLLSHGNDLGLFSEDILPKTGELSGNFPQTYSHVGLINAAFRLSRSWE
jgi:GH15 family glucan-1,4-alpha-glucosidase